MATTYALCLLTGSLLTPLRVPYRVDIVLGITAALLTQHRKRKVGQRTAA